MAPSAKAQRFANKWGARVIPLILVGLVAYTTWVVAVLIGVNYLLNPPNHLAPRTAVGIAIIVLYFILMVPMSLAYARTVYIVVTDPGFVPLPSRTRSKRRKTSRKRKGSHQVDSERDSSQSEKEGMTPSQQVGFLDRGAVYGGRTTPPAGLEQFYKRDIFECELDGLPRWCSVCMAFKPDRSHHSSEVGRCILKFDHYCPWAGGVVSETSFKAFLLFCVYGAVYCTFVIIVAAYFTAEQQRLSNLYNINWIVAIVLSGLFGIFSTGMALNSLNAVFQNSTTVDNLTRRTRIHHFCVLLPSPDPRGLADDAAGSNHGGDDSNSVPHPIAQFPTITYPLPGQTARSSLEQSPKPRTFAILATPTGSNPYLLSSRLENFKTVMGQYVWDWILPFKRSPCCSHSHQDHRFGDVMYQLGSVVDRVMIEAGLRPRSEKAVTNGGRRRARNKSSKRERSDLKGARHQSHREQQEPQGSFTMSRLEARV